ncbi:MAG: hypothetical protein LC122_12875 [Chitinophagales bacterium]|nr:hypothetical protein [Chitinophagales bacterium]
MTAIVDKILDHPDKDEIISKLLIDTSPKNIHNWLSSKYSNPGENKLILSERSLKDFKDNYLNLYKRIEDDILKTKFEKISPGQKLNLALSENKTYRSKILELADNKLDVEKMLANAIIAIESRAADVFDDISTNPINFKIDKTLIEYFDLLGNLIEKYYNMKRDQELDQRQAQQVVNNTQINIQVLDQHMTVFYEVVREVLAEMNLEQSMKFIELVNSKISKLKDINANTKESTIEKQFAEVRVLNADVQKLLNG